jgi:hypothetical protein
MRADARSATPVVNVRGLRKLAAALGSAALGFLGVTSATNAAENVRGSTSEVRTLFTRLGIVD